MADQAIDKMDAGAPVADAPAEDVKASEPAAEATAADGTLHRVLLPDDAEGGTQRG